jgi:hypothetical protein
MQRAPSCEPRCWPTAARTTGAWLRSEKQYDPEKLFIVPHGVGSEARSAGGFARGG